MKQKVIKLFMSLILTMAVIVSFSSCAIDSWISNVIYRVVSSHDIYMFSDIYEFENMEQSFLEYGDVEIIDNVEDDLLQSLQYEKSYNGRYVCSNFEFEVFAYVFSSNDMAQEYYANCGEVPQANTCRLYWNSLGNVRIIVLNNNEIYSIYYNEECEKEITNLLSRHLTLKMIYIQDKYPCNFEVVPNESYIR